jgi:hypothetical protein
MNYITWALIGMAGYSFTTLLVKCALAGQRGYGNVPAREELLEKVRQWVNLGMPSAGSFKLQVYPNKRRVEARENQWIVKRGESQFVWTLES